MFLHPHAIWGPRGEGPLLSSPCGPWGSVDNGEGQQDQPRPWPPIWLCDPWDPSTHFILSYLGIDPRAWV